MVPTDLDDDTFVTRIGLTQADNEEPGIVRRRCGRGFTFRWPDGTVVRGEERSRCEALVLPPAWTDVWVCPDADGHLQALGTDEAGRRQYRYHDRWTEARAAANFDRLAGVGRRLADLRRAVTRDLDSDEPRTRALAAMIGVLDRSLERVGNHGSVEEFGTRGISTLGPGNVDIFRRSIQLRFRGKGGVDHAVTVADEQLADAVAELRQASDEWLFEVDGSSLDASDANEYLDEHTAGHLDCKDLRTWGGSAAALTARVDDDTGEPQVADAAAEVLHNTRAVARSSYVHPAVFEATDEEVEAAWSSSRKSRWYGRGERALLHLLEDRPPLLDRHQVC